MKTINKKQKSNQMSITVVYSIFLLALGLLLVNTILIFNAQDAQMNVLKWKLETWSNFGQGLGLAAAFATVCSLILVIVTLGNQIKQMETQDESNSKKNELNSLNVFIKSQHEFLYHEEKRLGEMSLSNPVKQDNSCNSESTQRMVDLEFSIEMRKSFIKNCQSEVSENLNRYCEEDLDRPVSSKIREKLEKVCYKIGKYEGIPQCAILTNFQLLNIATLSNDKERLRYLQASGCFFSKWINDAFITTDDDEKLIIKDIEYYYKLKNQLPYESYDEFDSKMFAKIMSFVEQKRKGNNFQSNHILQSIQIRRIANLSSLNQLSGVSIEDLKFSVSRDFRVFSDLQVQQLKKELNPILGTV